MEKINLSEPDGTKQRWVDGAIRESALLGRAVSVSEYVRRAVEAYETSELVEDSRRAFVMLPHQRPVRTREEVAEMLEMTAADLIGESAGAVKREAKAPNPRECDPAAPPRPVRPPVTKESQTRKRKGAAR